MAAATVLTLALALTVYTFVQKSRVQTAFEDGDHAAVTRIMDQAPWLRLAQGRRYDYSRARQLLAAGDDAGALALFQALGGFEDSAAQARDIQYRQAVALLEAGRLEEADALLRQLAGHRDSAALIADIESYGKAGDIKDPQARYRAFLALGDLQDSPARAAAAAAEVMEAGLALYRAADFDAAAATLAGIEDYGDAADYMELCVLWQPELDAEAAQALLPLLEEKAKTLDIGPVAAKKEILPWFLDGEWTAADGGTASFDYAAYRRDFSAQPLAGPYIYMDGMLRPVGHGGPTLRFTILGYDEIRVQFTGGEDVTYRRAGD